MAGRLDFSELREDINSQPTDSGTYNGELKYTEEKQFLELQRLKDENSARKELIWWIFRVTVFWMIAILIIVLSVATGVTKLSDTVLVTLITTTTANVFGFMIIVTKYLFNEQKST